MLFFDGRVAEAGFAGRWGIHPPEPAATEMHSTTVETAVRSTAEPATTEPAVRATANSPLQNRAAGTKSCAATFDYYLAVSATLDTTAPTEDMVIISNEQNGARDYLRGSVSGGRNVFNGELNHDDRFGDSGWYGGLGWTRTLSENWFAQVSAGASVGGFFLPRFRTDGLINRKLLRRRQLVVTAGVGFDHPSWKIDRPVQMQPTFRL